MERWMGILGLLFFVIISFFLSERRRNVSWRLVGWGLILQIALALAVLGIPALGIEGPLRMFFDLANQAILGLLNFSEEGSRFIFGNLVDIEKSGFIFAFRVLPSIIFMAALMAVLYQLGIMQKIVNTIAWVMQRFMGISGAESLSTAANIFVGQTEAPLLIKPYVGSLTRSELFTVMVGGMASVAGGVMAAYVGLLRDRIPDIAGHLLTASVMSAPAALVVAKIMIPETERPVTLGNSPQAGQDPLDRNIIEAAARGAHEGLYLSLNVAAMLLAFIALISMVNTLCVHLGHWISFESWGKTWVPEHVLNGKSLELSFELILGWIFSPMAWLMGIPWHEAGAAGSLLGEKLVFNEFVAYLHLSQISEHLSERSMIILSYALCGFANFSSIAVQIAGIGGMAPERKSELAELGIRSIIGGSFAAFMTATIAGILI